MYGCPPDFGSTAHVHPDQHDLDFMVASKKAIMYFANDGGIYRTLDGFSGLTTGTCGGTNQFDSLNQTLGSMTQFVSFSQHPTDANTLLGGTQDNGSPATALALSSTSWLNVNSGDGGYNLINPDNPTEWFTANTDVSIQRCALGINCHAQDFGIVVSNATVGGDSGPFYTPYILDPQDSGEMLVGTCRVWRGTTGGAGFAALSNNFDTGSSVACTGSEVNLVRALAVGGPKDGSGFSNVIYAGTEGWGPFAPTSPTGGHVWVSTNAALKIPGKATRNVARVIDVGTGSVRCARIINLRVGSLRQCQRRGRCQQHHSQQGRFVSIRRRPPIWKPSNCALVRGQQSRCRVLHTL